MDESSEIGTQSKCIENLPNLAIMDFGFLVLLMKSLLADSLKFDPLNNLREVKHNSLKDIIRSLDLNNAELVEANLVSVNKAVGSAGKSILLVAKLLSETKKLLKNKNWIAITESGFLLVNGRVARDLASAFDSWLNSSSIPEAALTHVSARTLARIGKVESSLRLKVENCIKEGNRYTEKDLSNFLQKSSSPKPLSELIKNAMLKVERMTDIEKLQIFPKIFIENIKLKKRVQALEAKVFQYENK